MWEGLFLLLTLSTIMAVASFLAGMLPLSLHLGQRQLRLLTAIGTGVLVGTALIVIIPEGVETLYAASSGSPQAQARAVAVSDVSAHGRASSLDAHSPERADEVDGIQLDSRSIVEPDYSTVWQREARSDDSDDTVGNTEEGDPPPAETKPPDEDEDEGDASTHKKPSDAHKEPPEPHVYVGLALVLGFALMYVIDVLPDSNLSLASRSRRLSRPLYISLNNLHRGAHSAPDSSPALNPSDSTGTDDHSSSGGVPHASPPTTTLGLVIHAIADGIALGASSASTSSSRSLGFVVFLALMLHKAPAAFGLTAVLLKKGLSTRAARAHLIVFSLAAPVGALATWISVNLLGSAHLLSGHGDKDEMGFDRAGWWTGLVLVFSGGTFLYVAMHSMQETTGGHSRAGSHGGRLHQRSGSEVENGHNGSLNPYAGGNDFYSRRGKNDDSRKAVTEIVAVVGGMFLPLIAQMGGHSH